MFQFHGQHMEDYDVADPDFEPYDGDQYDQQLFEEKQSFVYSVLVTSLQTDKGRELVMNMKGMQEQSFQNCITIIHSQMLHSMIHYKSEPY